MARAENDPIAGPEQQGTIENVSLVVACDGTITAQLKLLGATTASWAMVPRPAWLNADFEATGKIAAAIPLLDRAQVFNVNIYAGDALSSATPSKPFTIVAEKCKDGEFITFVNPLPGSFINSLCTDCRLHPVNNTPVPHTGVDLKLPNGKLGNVVAAADGVVVSAGLNGTLTTGYGNLVVIEHKNKKGKVMCITKYAHLSKILVKQGMKVTQGTPIGVEGKTGGVTGAHLHFEMRGPSGEVWDPAAYIAAKIDDEKPGGARGVTSPTVWADTEKPFFAIGPAPAKQVIGKNSLPAYISTATNTGTTQAEKDRLKAEALGRLVASHLKPKVVGLTPAKVDNPCSKKFATKATGTTTAPEVSPPSAPLTPPVDISPAPTPLPQLQCWEKAFIFTMRSEVNDKFESLSKIDAVIAGCMSMNAKNARLNCGQITDEGGLTKFGVAAKFNGQSTVANLDLENAKTIFKAKYFDKSIAPSIISCPRAALIASTYFHLGPKHLLNILKLLTGTTGTAAATKLNAMADQEFIDKFTAARIEEMKTAKTWVKYEKPFTKRAMNEKSWAKTMFT